MDRSRPDENSMLHELAELRRQNEELKAIVEKMVADQKHSLLFEKSAIPTTLSRLPEDIIVDVNEAFEREFGIAKQDAVGKTTLDLGISPDAEGRKRILERLKKSDSVRHQEMVIYSKSGEKRYYETNIEKVVVNGEEYLLYTTQNISEYKRAKRKLKENYDLIRIAGEKAKLGGWNVILKENRIYWSDEVAAILEVPAGYSPLVEDAIKFYAPEWRSKFTEVFNRCANEGIPYDEEMEIITSTGKRVWIRTIAEAIKDKNGKIFKIQGALQDITLKKQAEEKIKDSEARYKAIFESTGTATLIVDEDMTILMANTECLSTTGYAPSELIGRKWTDYVALESLEEMIKNHELRRKNPGMVFPKYEVKLLDKNGEKHDVILNVNMIQGTNHSVVSMPDITKRKRAEAALEEYFENDISADYIATVSGEIVSCNKMFLDLFGFEKKSDTENFNFTNLYKNSADRKQIIRLLTQYRKIENYEVEFVSKDGKTIHALVNAVGIFDKNDKLEKNRGYIVEISEQKRVEKELLKLSRAVEQSPASVIITDLEGNIEYANPKALAITGYSKEEMIGLNPRILNPGEKQKNKYIQLWETISSGKEWFGEFHSKKKNGELYWELASISPIFNEKKEIINYVAVKEDITERKKFIDDLQTAKETAEESQQKYKRLFSNMMNAFGLHEMIFNEKGEPVDYKFLEVNPVWEKIVGIKAKDIIGKRIKEIMPNIEQAWLKRYGKIVRTGIPEEFTDYNEATQKYYNVFAYKHEGNKFAVVFNDVTDKKQFEAELIKAKEKAEENEKKFSVAFHSSPNVSMITNIDTGEILEANNAVELVAGFSRDEVIGNSVYNQNLWMIERAREKFIEKLLRDKKVLDFESTFRKKSGEHFIGLISGQMIQIQNQNCILSIIHDITDRKNAETELLKALEKVEESEEKFRNLYESLSLAYLILKDGVCIECNEATVSILGVESKDDIIGKSPIDFSPEFQFNNLKSSEAAAKFIQNTIEKGFQTFEWLAMRNNNETFFSEVSLKKLYYKNELHIQCLIADITERKQIETELVAAKEKAEENEHSLLLKNEEYESINKELWQTNDELKTAKEKVEESENKFKNLYESLSLAYLIIKDGVCIDCNKAALDIYGIENKDEIIGKPPTDFSPEFQPNKKSSLDEAIRQTEIALKKGYHTFEWVAMRKNKELFYNEVSLKKFYYKNELHLQCLTTDITERKRIENELIAAKEKAEDNERKLLEANEIAKLGSWELDIETETFTFTDSFYKIFQTTASEMGGYQMSMENYAKHFVHPEDASMVTEEIKKSIETLDSNISHYVEHRMVYKNGNHGYIGVWFYIVKDESGKVIKTYGVNQDITERKIAELELIHAKEKAEESDRLKSAFLANMSHEIRTPMNGILGFTQLLLEPDLSSEQKDNFINIVHQSGQRMLNTVNDIVEISKIEAGLVVLKKELTDINNRMAELVHFFTPEVEKKGLQLVLKESLPETAKRLITDENKLDSILTNLIKNAIKYTDSGTITVGCRLIGSELECYVKDTGMGIPKDRQQAIFERFIQADIADTRVFEGSGLGLAICKSYVEMLSGKIWVESEEGKGSTFYFTIPAGTKMEDKSKERNGILLDNKKAKTKELKILIAEDDEASRKYISLIIKDSCKEVFEADNGIKTIELCRKNKDIDIILMDIQMPGLDGYEATRQIREFNQDIIIIAQTAFALSGDKEKAIDAGCNDYITKPINKNQLQSMILKYFGKEL